MSEPPVPAKEWRLVRDWKWVLAKSWSSRFMFAAAFLSGLEAIMPGLMDNPIFTHDGMVVIMFLLTASALIARMVAQKEAS